MIRVLKNITLLSFQIQLFVALLALNINAQNTNQKFINNSPSNQCGLNDKLHDSLKLYDQNYKNSAQYFRNILVQNMQNNVKSNNKLQIPCVVHVFHKNDGNTSNHGEISRDEVRNGIRILNENLKNYNIDSYGVDANIEVVLAARDENGNCTDGINYIDMSNDADYYDHGLSSDGVDEADLYAHRWDVRYYYNIYVVTEINNGRTNGSAYYPETFSFINDGTYICYYRFSTTTLVHEIGHALNLMHTFKGDGPDPQNWTSSTAYCPSNGDCSTDGDECCDTPPHIRSWDCPCGTNSCDNNSKKSEFTKNIMSYNDCRIGFTSDQKTRMRAAVNNLRDDLLYSNGNMNLIPPSTGITFDISASKTSIKVADSTTLFTTNSCGLPFSGFSDHKDITFLWTIDDPNDSYLPMKSNHPTFTFYNPGTYDVTLELTTNGTTYTKTETDVITVTGLSANSPNGWANGSSGPSVSAPSLSQSNSIFDFVPEYGKVFFRIEEVEKLDNCDATNTFALFPESELDYIHKVSALRFTSSGASWDYKGNYGPYDECNSFIINPKHIFFNDDLTSGGYSLYNVSAASWEDDDGIQDIWATCTGFTPCDDCIDTWKLSGWKWLNEESGKNYFGGDWFLFDVIDEGNDWKLTINANYLFSNTYGNSISDAIDFGTIDDHTCPDEIAYYSNYDRTASDMYFEFTLTNSRRIKIDLGFQNGYTDFTLRDATNNQLTAYYETNTLPDEYLSNGVYEKKYDLSAGTYYVKVNSPYQGRFKLKLGPDDNPTNNKWIWTGLFELPSGSTLSINEDSWHNALNWDPCHTLPDENSNVEIPYNQGEHQPKIYAGETGKCKSIKIETNNGAKLSIEATGKLDVEN